MLTKKKSGKRKGHRKKDKAKVGKAVVRKNQRKQLEDSWYVK